MTSNEPNSDDYQAQARRSLVWFSLCLLLLGGLVAGFNASIDPQARFLFLDKPGFNQIKTELQTKTRKGKTTALRQCNYDTIVLGTSRAETAFAMGHPTLEGAEPYNAALRAGTIYEMRRLAEYANRQGNLNLVLLSLDYEAFNSRIVFAEDFPESPLAETLSLFFNSTISIFTANDRAVPGNTNVEYPGQSHHVPRQRRTRTNI